MFTRTLLVLAMCLPMMGATGSRTHDIIYVTRTDFYISEASGAGVVELKRCCHGNTVATVDAATTDGGTATAGDDYAVTTRTIRFSSPVEDADLEVPITNDTYTESLETIEVSVANPTGNATLGPDRGTITVIDDDGPARFSFSRATTESYENFGSIEFVVIRSGDLAAASVAYATTDGSAQAGADYTATSGSIAFDAGQRIKRFTVPVENDRLQEGAEDFSVTLSDPTGAELAEPSVISATILDDETASSDTTPPVSYFHQPLHGETYRPGQIRDILAFADDYGTGVKRVDVALLAKKTNGSCRWFSKKAKGFVRGPCKEKVWMRFRTDETVVYTLPRKLRPSRRSKIRYYKAWARGKDEIGNVEQAFEPFRNLSKFEVR